jgi:TATA-box binding protein (TBP) (component of TFIID and TFIIIB)
LTEIIALSVFANQAKMNKPYRISTITATGALGSSVNLDKLYSNIDLDNSPDVLFVEYGKKINSRHANDQERKKICDKLEKKSKRFDNQVTVLRKDADKDIYISTKIFKNGNVQMTGVRSDQRGLENIGVIHGIVAGAYEKDSNVVDDIKALKPSAYAVRLINSDFKIGFPLRRDVLYKIMMSSYKNNCSYEPCIYPGVKIQYFYNKEASVKNGVCSCSVPCIVGKKCGCGDRQCKKVTIAVFQSGSVIITGAQYIDQIDEVYAYIHDILVTHESKIKKVVLVDTLPPTTLQATTPVAVKPPKIFTLQKSSIIVPHALKDSFA